MKLGDMVTAIDNATLLSDSLENIASINKVYYGHKREVLHFRKGDLAFVVAFHHEDERAKVFYQNEFWWANTADLKVISS